MPHVVVINPTSSTELTAGLQTSLDATAHRWGVTAAAVTSYGGPRAIETDDDGRAAIHPMLATAGQHRADAYVVGCFSDPGLDELRAAAPVPVIGMAEAALSSAMAHSRRIGVVSTAAMATFRHELYWAKLGVSGRVVADLAINRGQHELATRDAANDVLAASRELVRRGAEAVILGCVGLAHLRAPLAEEIGVAVIEPCAAGVAMAAQALADRPRPRVATPPAHYQAPQYQPAAPQHHEPAAEQYDPAPPYEPQYPQYDRPAGYDQPARYGQYDQGQQYPSQHRSAKVYH